eukprot:CAMPEP_0169164972 /NCGR_PEP_ID=MMETSP1015-20121227/59153_1 /TAXON_ID=342587 /ORGANISM="Karlodinium micrum, Strain CCMP2283" /LENGTH=282 /DNA_ID=CAMNT_0009237511 /DNA_START=111 /DNA_END=959 /DNA_ORIENTATION=+
MMPPPGLTPPSLMLSGPPGLDLTTPPGLAKADAKSVPPPPMQPPSLMISLQASLPPLVETPAPLSLTPSNSVQVSLCAALPPPSPSFLPPPSSPRFSASASPPFLQAPPSPFSPLLSSPFFQQPPSPFLPSSLPPSYPAFMPCGIPQVLSPSIMAVSDPSLPPCWDAWGFKRELDDATPTTCVGSDDESTVGFSMGEHSVPTSESEMEIVTRTQHSEIVESSSQSLQPPPGLEGCLCPLFLEGQSCGSCHTAKKKDCNAAQIAIAQLLGLNTAGRSYAYCKY